MTPLAVMVMMGSVVSVMLLVTVVRMVPDDVRLPEAVGCEVDEQYLNQ